MPIVEDARYEEGFRKGFQAGIAGRTRGANPYPLDTSRYRGWLAGWNNAQANKQVKAGKVPFKNGRVM